MRVKILFLFLFFIPVFNSKAQVNTIKSDTIQVVKEGKSAGNSKNSQSGAGNASNSQNIKEIKGARPDMSKGRGARPPQITRPSGSVVPRGIGKPAGAGRRGGR